MASKNKKPEKMDGNDTRDKLCVKELKCKTEKQKELVHSIRNKEITICSGSAGTGKTFVTINTALKLLKEGYKKVILCKSVTSIPEEEIGFLKGNIEQKMEPFIMSYVGNLNKMLPNGVAEKLFEEKIIEVLPLAYILIRLGGVTLSWASFPLAEIIGLTYSVVMMRRLYKKEISNL